MRFIILFLLSLNCFADDYVVKQLSEDNVRLNQEYAGFRDPDATVIKIWDYDREAQEHRNRSQKRFVDAYPNYQPTQSNQKPDSFYFDSNGRIRSHQQDDLDFARIQQERQKRRIERDYRNH